MNYQKIYDSLITKRKNKPKTKGYTEKHHILPRSMGGSDDSTNLVVLSGREHWVAHLLLYKIHKNRQTMYACHMMAMRCEERGIPRVRNSRMYQRVRIECAKSVHLYTSKKGPANSQYGTMWICNIKLKENKKISKQESIPSGWIAGRNKWKKSSYEVKYGGRKKLKEPFYITDGKKDRILYWEDQKIPKGWSKGKTNNSRILTEEGKQKIREGCYRKIGTKYNKKGGSYKGHYSGL